ncbi:phage portal protein [Longimicrobium sp.]|uniref:phage portal protein n=1 Tax=Longimicrobium sp. TaxID=2029185 RepID=UPI0032C22A77
MKWWFGRKAGRDARPFLFRWGQGGAAVSGGEWPRSYEAQVREAYLGNPVAQRAVRLVAESAASAVVYAIQDGVGEAETGARAGPPPPAFGWSPSPFRGGLITSALLETVVTHLLLHGNAYLQVLLDADGVPAELFALRPERVSVEADAGGWPAAYLYKAGEARSRVAARDGLGKPGLVHLKSVHPLDDHYGLGCLGAAAGAVAIHNAASRWNKALLDNAARPSGALVYAPGDGSALSADQFSRLREELEAQFSGAGNAGRPMLLEGGLSWQAMSLSPADMDFVGLKAAAAREIALAFGVPPMLLGLPGDATYANYREANRALWRLSVLPTADMILTALLQGLAGWFEGATLTVELDRVPALADDRAALWQSASAATFLTDDEKRAMVGLAPKGASS